MERRTFAIGLGLGLALPALPEAGRLGMSDIARIRSAEERLINADALQGGARLADGADRYIRYVEQAVRRCAVSSRVQTALHQSLGEMYANIGWLHYDASRHETARQRWDTALRYALLARDPMLQARAWSCIARQAADLGHGSEAVAVARARGQRNRVCQPCSTLASPSATPSREPREKIVARIGVIAAKRRVTSCCAGPSPITRTAARFRPGTSTPACCKPKPLPTAGTHC